jgi:hypothetical protein
LTQGEDLATDGIPTLHHFRLQDTRDRQLLQKNIWLCYATSYITDWDFSSRYQVIIPWGNHAGSRYKDGQTTKLLTKPEEVFEVLKTVLPAHTTRGWKSLTDATVDLETLYEWGTERRSFNVQDFTIVVDDITTGAVRTDQESKNFDENYTRPPRRFERGCIQRMENIGVTSIRTGRTMRQEVLYKLRSMNLGTRTLPCNLILLWEYSHRLADMVTNNLQEGLYVDQDATGEKDCSDESDDGFTTIASACCHGVVRIRVRKTLPASNSHSTCKKAVCISRAWALERTYETAKGLKLIPRPSRMPRSHNRLPRPDTGYQLFPPALRSGKRYSTSRRDQGEKEGHNKRNHSSNDIDLRASTSTGYTGGKEFTFNKGPTQVPVVDNLGPETPPLIMNLKEERVSDSD